MIQSECYLKILFKDTDDSDNKIIAQLKAESKTAHEAFHDNGEPLNEVDLQKIIDDIQNFSKKYPESVFQLDVDKLRHNNDLSRLYFHNATIQPAKSSIIFQDFNWDYV